MNYVAELARAMHRGDLEAGRKVLANARYTNTSINEGIRAGERDMGRDPPLPDAEPLRIGPGEPDMPSIYPNRAFNQRRKKAA